jgi:hypothetical protein
VDNVIEIAGLVKLRGTQMLGTLGDAGDTWGSVEVLTKIELATFGKREQANGYVLFDVVNSTNFKFAGLDISGDRVVVGQVVNGKWTVLASQVFDMRSGAEYKLAVALSDNGVRVSVNGTERVVHSFKELVVDGGYGLAATGVQANFKETKITGALAINAVDESVEAALATQATTTSLSATTTTTSKLAATSTTSDSLAVDWGDTAVSTTSTAPSNPTTGSTADLGSTSSGGTFQTDPAPTDTKSSSTSPKKSAQLVVVESWMPRDEFATGTTG